MPNIYLRMPVSRCQFFRHRDPQHTIPPSHPLAFSAYMPEHFVLRSSLTNASVVTQTVNMQCFSHQQWQNMTNGRPPLGGHVALTRDRNEYLTYDEVQFLNGQQGHSKGANEDYLCIKLPSEVEVVDTVRNVTPSWNLDVSGVRTLLCMLNNDFKRSVVEWALATFDYCTSKNGIVARAQSASLERYLMRYGIDPSVQEKDNLRRIIDRWLRSEHTHFDAYNCVEMQYGDDQERHTRIGQIQWL